MLKPMILISVRKNDNSEFIFYHVCSIRANASDLEVVQMATEETAKAFSDMFHMRLEAVLDMYHFFAHKVEIELP